MVKLKCQSHILLKGLIFLEITFDLFLHSLSPVSPNPLHQLHISLNVDLTLTLLSFIRCWRGKRWRYGQVIYEQRRGCVRHRGKMLLCNLFLIDSSNKLRTVLCFSLLWIHRRCKAQVKVRTKFETCFSMRDVLRCKHFPFPVFLRPGFVPCLAAPKIPEGERVDFDVSVSQDLLKSRLKTVR